MRYENVPRAAMETETRRVVETNRGRLERRWRDQEERTDTRRRHEDTSREHRVPSEHRCTL